MLIRFFDPNLSCHCGSQCVEVRFGSNPIKPQGIVDFVELFNDGLQTSIVSLCHIQATVTSANTTMKAFITVV